MKSITISNDQYQELTNRLDDISNQLSNNGSGKDQFVDNEKFVQLMNISKRTAQNWRDEGKIAFSQVGSKIYYKLSDIEELLKHHYNRAFSPEFKVKLAKNLQ